MATTKTIQPTGETITIPAMADQPDMSVVATDLGNITDAVNAQNQALSNLKNAVNLATIGTISTLDNLKSDLVSVANGMSTGENKPVMFNGTSSTAPFDNGKTYYGTLCVEYKASNNLYFSVLFHSYNGEIVSVGYDRGAWTIEQLAEKSDILINRIWRTTVTGTTDNNANLALPSNLGADLILFAWNDSRIFIPFRYNQRWYLHVQLTDLNGSGLAEESVTVYVMCAKITYET